MFSTILTGLVFIVWDVFFTKYGVWGFNEKYLIGINIINLPIEEWLFFICIPYACTFTHYALIELLPNFFYSENFFKKMVYLFATLSIIIAVIFFDRWYTFVNFLFFSIVFFVGFKTNPRLLKSFLPTFLVILFPFFLVNGLLTGSFIDEQVVWYNNEDNLAIRLGTIPVEDVFYAFSMLFLNLLLLECFEKIKT